jgi:hypothetical protein
MTRWRTFCDPSIKHKLMATGLFAMAVTAVCISGVQSFLSWREGRDEAVYDLMSTAQLIGMQVARELTLGSIKEVSDALATLGARPDIRYAAVYDNTGRLVGGYRAGGIAAIPT